jgi:hypothetical protein
VADARALIRCPRLLSQQPEPDTTMSVVELQELEEVKALLAKGQQLGVLTFGDVAAAVSEVDLDESDVEDLYGHIERQGIELVEDVDPAQRAAADALPAADGKKGRRRQKATLDLKPIAANAREKIAAAIAEYQKSEDGLKVDAKIDSLTLADIAFDSKTLRVVAEAGGSLKVVVTKLSGM